VHGLSVPQKRMRARLYARGEVFDARARLRVALGSRGLRRAPQARAAKALFQGLVRVGTGWLGCRLLGKLCRLFVEHRTPAEPKEVKGEEEEEEALRTSHMATPPARSCGPPCPPRRMQPSSSMASGRPLSAALPYQPRATARSRSTPSPLAYLRAHTRGIGPSGTT